MAQGRLALKFGMVKQVLNGHRNAKLFLATSSGQAGLNGADPPIPFPLSASLQERTTRTRCLALWAATLFILSVVACGTSAPTAAPDTQATVDAAVAATAAAQAEPTVTVEPTPDAQATIDAAVAATAVAEESVQATLDAAIEATAAAAPTPIRTEPDVITSEMSEEELAAEIEAAVAEAAEASEECSTATAEAAADETVTQEEAAAIEIYLTDAEASIAYAEELIYLYYGVYGELALETLYLLEAIEEDLALMAESAEWVEEILVEIYADLEQGLELTDEVIAQLEAAAEAASEMGFEAYAESQGWTEGLQAELESRAQVALETAPSEIATDRQAAVRGVLDYVEGARQALMDSKLSGAELGEISQLGADAIAGLEAQGGLQLQQLTGVIDGITGQMARGSLSQAMGALAEFEALLGSIPTIPALPSWP